MLRLLKSITSLNLQGSRFDILKNITKIQNVGVAATAAASEESWEPDEFSGPKMLTTVPGPNSQRLLTQMSEIQNSQDVNMFIDYHESLGNYLVDADGNRYMDLFMQIASVPLGYNHPALIRALHNPRNRDLLINRPNMCTFPPYNLPERLTNTLLAVAPTGMSQVYTMGCGSCANEFAFKVVWAHYRNKQTGQSPITNEEMESSVINQAPGCKPYTILSFMGSMHGRTLGVLTCTHNKWQVKLDSPGLDWPIADFPTIKYPLDEFKDENKREEQRVLDQVQDLILKYNKKGTPVAGLIIEPIQSEGGDKHASADFFIRLQKIAKENGTSFIVDEVQTSLAATGKFWAHEHWNLPMPPDIVTFGKKMQQGGFYYRDEYRVKEGGRIFNTWTGDPSKLVLLEEILNVVNEQGLMQNVRDTGRLLLMALKDLEERYPDKVMNARGTGTYCAIDCKNQEFRNKLAGELQSQGLLVGKCGEKTIRLRPALILRPKHIPIIHSISEKVLANQRLQ